MAVGRLDKDSCLIDVWQLAIKMGVYFEEYVHFTLIIFFTVLTLDGKEIIEIQTGQGKMDNTKLMT